MTAGEQIRRFREERGLRPADIERLTQRLAADLKNPDYAVPHATLNGIEAGSTPTIYKLAGLAASLDLPMDKLLLIYGIDRPHGDSDSPLIATRLEMDAEEVSLAIAVDGLAETSIVPVESPLCRLLPARIRGKLGSPARFSYAVIGLNEDILADILPGGSFVEIDRQQNAVSRSAWRSLLQRPVYCLWHSEGHVCCWCDQIGNVITIVPHPLSRHRTRQLRTPRDVNVIGRVTNSWRLIIPERESTAA